MQDAIWRLIFLGAPGSGKGTLAELFEKRFPIIHLGSGEIFREAMRSKTPLGMKADKYIQAGQLVPDDVVFSMMEERLDELKQDDSFILDGYPRTLNQASLLEASFKKRGWNLTAVISLEVNENILLTRLLGRKMCELCGTIYHAKQFKNGEELRCKKDGTVLTQRNDDNLESVLARFKAFETQTLPIKGFYAERHSLVGVDASWEAERVLEYVQEVLRKNV